MLRGINILPSYLNALSVAINQQSKAKQANKKSLVRKYQLSEKNFKNYCVYLPYTL